MTSTRTYQLIVGVAMAVVIVVALLVVPPSSDFAELFGDGNLARVLFFHVPCAMVAFVSMIVAAVHAGRYLRTRDFSADLKSAVAVELGCLFCTLALVTGIAFAHATWYKLTGQYWNWDPRETSLAVLLLLYAAYLALRGAIAEPASRASAAAAYALLSVPAAVFLVFVVPRIPALQSLHPDVVLKRGGLDAAYRGVLLTSMAVFVALYCWLFTLLVRVRTLAEEVAWRRAQSDS